MKLQTGPRGLARMLIICTGVALAPHAPAQDTITLIGIVRDFRADHSDFAITPLLGAGHYAGNVRFELDTRERPMTASEDGFEVATQWRNATSDPIAPHMYADPSSGVIRLRSTPVLDNTAYLDSYDSGLGTYDSQTPGPQPLILTDGVAPIIPSPGSLPPLQGDILLEGTDITTEYSSDVHCTRFRVRNSHKVSIVGDVTLYVRGDILIEQLGTVLQIADGGSLTIFVEGQFYMRNSSVLNASGDPDRVTIYNLGTTDMVIEQNAKLSATVVSPFASLVISNTGDFYGSLDGAGLRMDNSSGFHSVGFPPLDACGVLIADGAGIKGFGSTGDITSESTFAQWYRDIDGINASKRHAITLRSVGDGKLEYGSPAFFPIDEQLYGNEGRSHNLHFTYQVDAHFTYQACLNQIVELQGTDDIWVFVDDQLLIDLGGIGADQVQVGEMDRLNLVDGETYTMRIFYAHRSNNTPSFRLRTNITLNSSLLSANVPVYAGWD